MLTSAVQEDRRSNIGPPLWLGVPVFSPTVGCCSTCADQVLINSVIVHVVFKAKFRRLEAILAEWLFVGVVEFSAMSWETIFVLTGMLCGAYWALTRKPRR